MKKGEIYLVNFEPAFGSEIKKTRPAVIIQSSDINSNLITVMPISSKINSQTNDDIFILKDDQNRLFSDSIIKVQQISSFDQKRFVHFIGKFDQKIQQKITKYLKIHFDL